MAGYLARGAGDPVEMRPNRHPTQPLVVIRNEHGHVVEETNFDPGVGIVIALDDLPTVGQIAVIPPGKGRTGLYIPGVGEVPHG